MKNLKVFKNSRVIITGHTGFKGSWLTAWLKQLGANIMGISLDVPTHPSHFKVSNIGKNIKDIRLDIRDEKKLEKKIINFKPKFVFHLAAQSLVAKSYQEPSLTWQTNVIGTLNVLQALRKLKNVCNAVIITSDKCYFNKEIRYGYKETDILGGKDPYSGSKASAEILVKSCIDSFFLKSNKNIRIATARAGNVIGGGDWANYRIIPDCVRSWSKYEKVKLRNPNATRPWQHVLEPLSGYLRLGELLYSNKDLCGESFNFGPKPETNFSVEHLMIEMSKYWSEVKWKVEVLDNNVKEAGLLKLNCDKALHSLDWVPNLNFNDTVTLVANWYKTYFNNPKSNMKEFTLEQIKFYEKVAYNQNLSWIK